jgi:hypothetical protein
MAVFRIEKTQNYTVMSNHHLRNAALSLKAKGLLSQMLSLPDEWSYSLKGLARINVENVSAIRTAVNELERAGYIVRRQGRDDKGKMAGYIYTVYEEPQNNPDEITPPSCDFPTTDNPTTGKPITEKPTSDNRTQLNKERALLNKKELNNDLLNTDSIPFTSPRIREDGADTPPERKGTETAQSQAFEIYREIILENLEYEIMLDRYKYEADRINEIVDLILENVCTAKKTLRIAGDDDPAELVKSKFLKLDSSHLEFVLDCLKKNTTDIRNIKKYLLAMLFNAPSTIGSYYTALVAHDMANGFLSGGGK